MKIAFFEDRRKTYEYNYIDGNLILYKKKSSANIVEIFVPHQNIVLDCGNQVSRLYPGENVATSTTSTV